MASEQERTRRTAGVRTRGRAAEVVERILRATGEELSRVGYAALRVEDVASRSGVNKTTIYRRWPTKPELVAAAVRAVMSRRAEIDTGTLRGDLRASLVELITMGANPLGQGILRIMQTERADPEVDALTKSLRAEQRALRRAMIERGFRRGDLKTRMSAEMVVDLVTAPVVTRLITFGDTLDESYVDNVLDVVLAGLAACP